MAEFKYIIATVQTKTHRRPTPFIFPKEINHDDFYRTINYHYRRNTDDQFIDVISAGFVNLGMSTKVHGRSETLGVSSREEDSQLILMYQYGIGEEIN